MDNQILPPYNFTVLDGLGECCGSSHLYDPKTQLCCKETTRVKIHNVSRHDVNESSCCGLNTYNTSGEVCCNKVVNPKESGKQCCGKGLYIPDDELCCRNERVSKEGGLTTCCNNRGFDNNKQICYKYRIYDKFDMPCEKPDVLRYTAVPYNTYRDSCCEGEITQGIPQKIQARGCCGNKSYLENTHMCCSSNNQYGSNPNNILHERSAPGLRCCGEGTYNVESELCCSDTPQPKGSNDTACCGTRSYNSNTEICCRGTVLSKTLGDACCGIEAYNSLMDTCCVNNYGETEMYSNKRGLCCGTLIYNPTEHICFSDYTGFELVPKIEEDHDDVCYSWQMPPVTFNSTIQVNKDLCVYATPGTPLNEGDCCNSEGFNPDTHICCSAKLYLKTSTDMVCCGTDIMDENDTTKICCDKSLQSTEHQRTMCTGQTSHNSSETVCNGVRHPVANGTCCGKQILNISSEICCGNRPQDKHNSTQYCCENVRYTNETEGMQCCGPVLINPTTDRCCQSKFIYSKENASMCCDPNNYDRTSGTCCQGIMYPGIDGGECCGQRIVRDPESETCCGGVFVDLIEMYRSGFFYPQICCGGVMKHAKHDQSVCCGGNVINGDDTGCCNGRLMIKERQICCGGEVQNLAHTNEKCCDNKPYDNRLQGCCDTILYNISDSSCYNETVTINTNSTNDVADNNTTADYQPLTQVSPSPVDIGVRELCVEDESLGCCSGLRYTKSQQGCCNGTIYQQSESTCCGTRVCHLAKGTECCDSTNYNPEEKICCHGKLHKKTPNAACCKTKVFDLRKEFCCKGVPIPSKRLTPKWSEHCCPSGQGISKLNGTCKEVNSSDAGLMDVVLPFCKQCSNCPQDSKWKKSLKSKHTIFSFTVDSWVAKNKYMDITVSKVKIIKKDKTTKHKNLTKLQLSSKCTCCRLETNVRYIAMVTENINSNSFRLSKTDKIYKSHIDLEEKIRKYIRRKAELKENFG
ncbi:uncharacterized protein LOC117123971 [Anneissia japonica]|uniref:uncharacterized protein LOC117123971 n=1 Tax=Anneissia japonica TaxID=1529436 RepID=UPI0014259A30|nr:uncharacterized protein LOC117123971 [Anneissia japonica]